MESPEEIGLRIFSLVERMVKNKIALIEILGQKKPLPHAARQTDVPGEYRIDVDYPTEKQAKKNRYLIRIVVMLDGSCIKVTKGSSTDQLTYLPEDVNRSVRDAAAMITTY